MIDQLLDFTRVRVGNGIPLQIKEVDIVPILRQTLDELDDANPTCALKLEVTGDASGVWDEDRLAQVFSNLVGNAVQHGKPEAGVRVELHGTTPDCVSVRVTNAGSIPSDRLPRLFEPLMGGSEARDGSYGLGLGLFISHEIVRAHRGSILVASNDHDGTTFTVTLPRNPRNVRASRP
jgi:signal transduction histidine kinase